MVENVWIGLNARFKFMHGLEGLGMNRWETVLAILIDRCLDIIIIGFSIYSVYKPKLRIYPTIIIIDINNQQISSFSPIEKSLARLYLFSFMHFRYNSLVAVYSFSQNLLDLLLVSQKILFCLLYIKTYLLQIKFFHFRTFAKKCDMR
jgi:hypothetical protein